jgi:hypothetical protein
MRNTSFIWITLLIILLCGLAVPFYKEGLTEKEVKCSNYNNNGQQCINNKCVYDGKTDKCSSSKG